MIRVKAITVHNQKDLLILSACAAALSSKKTTSAHTSQSKTTCRMLSNILKQMVGIICSGFMLKARETVLCAEDLFKRQAATAAVRKPAGG